MIKSDEVTAAEMLAECTSRAQLFEWLMEQWQLELHGMITEFSSPVREDHNSANELADVVRRRWQELA